MTTLHEEPGRRNDEDSHSEPESAPVDELTTPRSQVTGITIFRLSCISRRGESNSLKSDNFKYDKIYEAHILLYLNRSRKLTLNQSS